MKYYKVASSHWKRELEFKSELDLPVGQCFRIKRHTGLREYPTRFIIIEAKDKPDYTGDIVEILEVDSTVEKFSIGEDS